METQLMASQANILGNENGQVLSCQECLMTRAKAK